MMNRKLRRKENKKTNRTISEAKKRILLIHKSV